jgi:hypothetical protein
MVVRLADLLKPTKLLIQIPVYAGKMGAAHPSIGILLQPGVVGDGSVIVLGQKMESHMLKRKKGAIGKTTNKVSKPKVTL